MKWMRGGLAGVATMLIAMNGAYLADIEHEASFMDFRDKKDVQALVAWLTVGFVAGAAGAFVSE